jgi:hypothetical protein
MDTPEPACLVEVERFWARVGGREELGALLNPTNASPPKLLHWSNRRRHHRAAARRSHYRRRLDSPSTGWITKSHWSASAPSPP